MADVNVASARPKRRRGWRVLGWVFAILIVLLVVAYFVGTSSPFIKRVVLPRASDSLNADITVSHAVLQPFSSIQLRDLKVQPRGREPLLTAREVRVQYSLFDILGGNLLIEDIAVVEPVVTLVEQPDGSSNLDPLLDAMESDEADKPDEPSEPPRIDLRRLVLTNATLRHEKLYSAGSRDVIQASNVNVRLTGLKNGDSGKVTLSADLGIDNNPPAPGSNGVLRATMNGEYVFALTSELMPLSVKGQAQVNVTRAEGAFGEMADLGIELASDISPSEITQLALSVLKGGTTLAELRANGPMNFEQMEGRVHVQLSGVDRRVLNMFGAPAGLDFGTTSVTSSNVIELADSGNRIGASGAFNLSQLQVIRTNQSSPTLDLRAQYDLTLDLARSNAVFRTMNLQGTQNGSPLLSGELTSPMNIAWGESAAAMGDSAFLLVLTNFDVAPWRPFIGDTLERGVLNASVRIHSQQGGKRIATEFQSQVANLAPVLEDKQLASATVVGQLAIDLSAAPNMSINGALQCSNVVVIDPQQAIPATPLSAGLEMDSTMSDQAIDLRRLRVALEPTDRARNDVLVSGRVDLSDTNAIQGRLDLTAEALDVTRYYDLFAGGAKKKEDQPAPATPAPGGAPGSSDDSQEEPEAIQLPVRDFVVNARIGRLYLRELEITNLQTQLGVNGSRINLDPFELAMNGAPVNGTVSLDLGVPGYRYALDFSARDVPFAPLVNTFAEEHRGQLQGSLTALADIQGAGITGASLQKNLQGQFDIGTTNLNLNPANIRQPMLKLLVSVVSMIPQLVQNPENALGAIGNLTRGLLPSNRAALDGTGEALQSPIDIIAARGTAGSGRIELQQATVRSTVFRADARGTITLAPVLTNSAIEIPVSIALSRPIAERIKMVPADTPTNAAYVPLPDFFTETGTIGEPKSRINAAALAGATLKQFGVDLPGSGGVTNIGGLIQGIGNVLGGNREASTNAPANTNAPGGVGGLIQGLGGLLGGSRDNRTTNTSTNTPPAPATNSSPAANILNQLLGPSTK